MLELEQQLQGRGADLDVLRTGGAEGGLREASVAQQGAVDWKSKEVRGQGQAAGLQTYRPTDLQRAEAPAAS